MKYTILFSIILCLLFVSSCKKESLDFSSNTSFGIKQVLEADNCNADCGETADCEGQSIKIIGKLDASNINASAHQFYLIDEQDDSFRIEVKVDAAIADDVFSKLNGQGGSIINAEGLMEGFDANTNFSCEKIFFLMVSDPSLVMVN